MSRGAAAVCVFALACLTGSILPSSRPCRPAPTSTAPAGVQGQAPQLPAAAAAPPAAASAAAAAIAPAPPAPGPPPPGNGSLTVILTQFLRPTLPELIRQIRLQSAPVAEIIVFQNRDYVNASGVL
eukprot:EG_transcript_47339